MGPAEPEADAFQPLLLAPAEKEMDLAIVIEVFEFEMRLLQAACFY